MSLTLVADLAAENSNSYVTVQYADDYWAGHYSVAKASQWTALNGTQKVTALIQACRVIESVRFTDQLTLPTLDFNPAYYLTGGRLYNPNLIPVKSYYTQYLQFPRNLDMNSSGGFYIPEGVKMAQCEQAVYLLSFDDSAIAMRLQGIEEDRLRAGEISTLQQLTAGGTALAPLALEYLRPFFYKSSKARRG